MTTSGRKRNVLRRVVLLCGTALAVSGLAPLVERALAAGSEPAVELKTEAAQPREVEEATQKAIERDYTAAWKSMITALGENRSDALDAGFVGIARDKLAARLEEQKKNGLRTRYVDKGHKLEAVFYSPEGSAMQLRDTATLEMQVLDGDTVVHQEDGTAYYIILMSVTEDRWKVRVFEQVPKF